MLEAGKEKDLLVVVLCINLSVALKLDPRRTDWI